MAELLGGLLGGLILGILLSTVLRWFLKGFIPKINPLAKNIIASFFLPFASLFINADLFIYYLITAIPILIVNIQQEKKANEKTTTSQ